VRKLIRGMAEDKTIVLSTHILEEVDAVCSRAIIIAKGRIVSDGTPAELEARSRLHNAVSITVRAGVSAGLRDALEGLPDVSGVDVSEDGEDRIRLQVLPKGEAILIEQVSRMVRERNWEIEEMHVERGQLDEVFRRVTLGEGASE
jgi:ABC-2 type transport system ATP-binding protein